MPGCRCGHRLYLFVLCSVCKLFLVLGEQLQTDRAGAELAQNTACSLLTLGNGSVSLG